MKHFQSVTGKECLFNKELKSEPLTVLGIVDGVGQEGTLAEQIFLEQINESLNDLANKEMDIPNPIKWVENSFYQLDSNFKKLSQNEDNPLACHFILALIWKEVVFVYGTGALSGLIIERDILVKLDGYPLKALPIGLLDKSQKTDLLHEAFCLNKGMIILLGTIDLLDRFLVKDLIKFQELQLNEIYKKIGDYPPCSLVAVRTD